MDPFLHILIALIFGLTLYWGFAHILHLNLYENWVLVLFIFAAILPDSAWVVYLHEVFEAIPPVPPYLVPFAQFFHAIPGQLLLWAWIAFAFSVCRIATYENVLTAGVAGAILHHIIDLVSHASGQYPLYPYVQQDWSIGYWLDNPFGLFGEVSSFGIILLVLFALLFLLIIISYRTVDLFERLPWSDLLFANLLLTTVLFSYWLGLNLTVALVILISTGWVLKRSRLLF